MPRKPLLLTIAILLCSIPAKAQIYPTQYRPPHQHWQQLKTDHFRILFPLGQHAAAQQTASILERQYPKVQQLTGGALDNFPVILTDYNDRSNGMVTSLHFRSEIAIPPLRGKSLNPETGSWLQNVVPHELVHALQFSHIGGAGIGWLVSFFSPDIARSIHGAAPTGIAEGLAVYHESNNVTVGGGRGNHPLFINQFNARSESDNPWSMGQMVHFPTETRPLNRHYIGGYEFTQWLHDTYSDSTSRDAIDFHVRWPFLGYGTALRHATGRWPSKLYEQFSEDKGPYTKTKISHYEPLALAFDGAEIRRPKWLSDSVLVFHSSFYNAEPGFYRYNLNNRSLKKLITTRSVPDYNYALSGDRKKIYYSYYRPDPLYPDAYKSQLAQYRFNKKSTQLLKTDHRLFAPSVSNDSTLYVLQIHKEGTKISKLKLTNYSVNNVFASPYQVVSVQPSPGGGNLAIVMNRNGDQGLWLTNPAGIKESLLSEPTLQFENGSVYDPAWHPSGDLLLFSADFSGNQQIYEYNLKTGIVYQLTDAPYNALEASYNPSGNRVAFIEQQKNLYRPVVVPRDSLLSERIEQEEGNPTPRTNNQLVNNKFSTITPYNPGLRWLKPRTLIPEIDDIPGGDSYQYGLGIHSSDLLQQQAYSLELTTTENRLWYDLNYRNKTFFPGFKTRLYSTPSYRRFRYAAGTDTLATQLLRQSRGAALSVPFTVTLQQNVNLTRFYAEPEIRAAQHRYFDEDGNHRSDFSNALIGNLFAQFSYKLRQNIRDVQPNSGLVIYTELEHYFQSQNTALQLGGKEITLRAAHPTALRGGIYGYAAPLEHWNQSLRVGLEGLTQSAPVFSSGSIQSDGFSEQLFPFANNLISLSTRYTIPLTSPDNGGLLLPLYLSNIYFTAFSNTVTDPTSANWMEQSRTVLGGGLRIQFRISNLSFDIGAGLGMEPTRNEIHYFIGDF